MQNKRHALMTTLSLLTTSSFDEEEDFTNEGII
jgi:hypothetical protein